MLRVLAYDAAVGIEYGLECVLAVVVVAGHFAPLYYESVAGCIVVVEKRLPPAGDFGGFRSSQ